MSPHFCITFDHNAKIPAAYRLNWRHGGRRCLHETSDYTLKHLGLAFAFWQNYFLLTSYLKMKKKNVLINSDAVKCSNGRKMHCPSIRRGSKNIHKKEGLFTSSLPQRLLNKEKARKHLLGTPCTPNGQWNTSTPFSVPPSHVTSLLCAARRPTAGGISCEQSVNNIRVETSVAATQITTHGNSQLSITSSST